MPMDDPELAEVLAPVRRRRVTKGVTAAAVGGVAIVVAVAAVLITVLAGSHPGRAGVVGPASAGQQGGSEPNPAATVSLQAAHSGGPPAAPGTSGVSLVSVNDQPSAATFALTAPGGPVSYYGITLVSGPAAHVLIVPAAGSIPAGRSVRITVTAWGKTSFSARIVISPGGRSVALHLTAKA
jgi:hypothetical protein